MVAPPQFADPAADYTGYRAGIQRVNVAAGNSPTSSMGDGGSDE